MYYTMLCYLTTSYCIIQVVLHYIALHYITLHDAQAAAPLASAPYCDLPGRANTALEVGEYHSDLDRVWIVSVSDREVAFCNKCFGRVW